MGVLNVTPDSFSDGGRFLDPNAALIRARTMVAEGADIIDVGGESTRPGARPVSVSEELDRVIPIIRAIHAEIPTRHSPNPKTSGEFPGCAAQDSGAEKPIPISIDTSRPEVMREAVAAGATIINDVRALREEGAMAAASELGREIDIRICLMHMQGKPRTMQAAPDYHNVVEEVRDFLLERVAACEALGIHRDRLWIDPGFGFGKTLAHNLQLLAHLDRLVDTGIPVLVGLSRKSMIGAILDKPVEERLPGSIATALIAATKGAAIVRVHDVGATADALKVLTAVSGVR
ncbi:MAG: dihydropteroate synthase [Gammaproteobacteria bacterium]|nr:dihydropteroate synthase [Gammaproteobacteria bacterium]